MTSEIPKFPRHWQGSEDEEAILKRFEKWRVETIKTLRKMLRENKPYGPSPMKKELIKDFLEALK